MASCKGCKHWTKVSEYERRGKIVAHGNCQLTNGEGYEPVHTGTLAFVMCDDGTGGMLYCDEDFGCVQFAKAGE